MALRFAGIDPRREVCRARLGNVRRRFSEIALRVDGQTGMPSIAASSMSVMPEPGLAAAGHADADGVGQEIAGVVEDEIVEAGAFLEIELLSEVEESELLVIRGMTCSGPV